MITPELLDQLEATREPGFLLFSAALRAAWARIAELEAAAKWHPIETAPKDGTEIYGGWLATSDLTPDPVHYYWRYVTGTPLCWQKCDKHEGWFSLGPETESESGEWSRGKWLNARDYPTHWRAREDRLIVHVA